jgi:hypothetical protein
MLEIAEAVRLHDQLQEARRAARFLLGASYEGAAEPYRALIRKVAATETVNALQAAIRIGSSLPVDDAIPLMMVLAAAVDELEAEARDALALRH